MGAAHALRPAMRPALLALAVSAALAGSAAGCGGGGDSSGARTIALLFPGQTPRYESTDRPAFEAKVKAACPACAILSYNAAGQPTKQERQAKAALGKGADVLVLAPVDSRFAAPVVDAAKTRGVPVLSYEKLVEGSEPDYYVGYDSEGVGELQAKMLSEKLQEDDSARGPIVMVVGETGDHQQYLFEEGAMRGFNAAGVQIAKRYSTPFWEARAARGEMRRAIAALGKDGFAGVYAETDSIAQGAIAAMRSAGIAPVTRPTTGRDATPPGLRRVLVGAQLMTVYEPIRAEARIGAEVALALARGEAVSAARINATVNNGKVQVPSVLLKPVAVTRDDLEQTVIADGLITPSELCAGPFESACRRAGIG